MLQYESTGLADHDMGGSFEFSRVKILRNFVKPGNECKHRTIRCLSQNLLMKKQQMVRGTECCALTLGDFFRHLASGPPKKQASEGAVRALVV